MPGGMRVFSFAIGTDLVPFSSPFSFLINKNTVNLAWDDIYRVATQFHSLRCLVCKHYYALFRYAELTSKTTGCRSPSPSTVHSPDPSYSVTPTRSSLKIRLSRYYSVSTVYSIFFIIAPAGRDCQRISQNSPEKRCKIADRILCRRLTLAD